MRIAVPARLAAVVSLALVSTACRTVWVRPDASEAMYQTDVARCKYGMSNEELQRIVASQDIPLPRRRSDWKRCMELLGWHTQVRSRGSDEWDYTRVSDGDAASQPDETH